MIIVGAGLTSAALLFLRTRQRPVVNPENAEWLTRIMLVESANSTSEEGIGVGWVAVNRVTRALWGKTVKAVVTGHEGSTWFGAARTAGYTRLISPSLLKHPKWNATYQIAVGILDNSIPNPIGNRTHFVHPWGLATCTTDNDCGKRRCINHAWLPVAAKQRCTPAWAMTSSIVISPALFAA